MSKKTPEEADIQAWKIFAQDIKPLKEKSKHSLFIKRRTTVNREKIHQHRRREYYEGQQQPLITERPTAGKIRKIMRITKIVVEDRIDLHGLTKEQAQQKLQFFLMNAQIQHKVWVLVITGKGRPETPVTLRSLVPGWLDMLPYVSGYASAKSIDGGDGALYVRLKKLPNR